MQAAIAFMFHDAFQVCRERLLGLRLLNPELSVYGIYGGDLDRRFCLAAAAGLGDLLDDLHLVRAGNPVWKWLHPDLVVTHWFRDVGGRKPFDALYVREWDLLLCPPLGDIYPAIDQDSVAFAGVRRAADVLAERGDRGWMWVSVPPLAARYAKYARLLRDRYGLATQTYFTQGPWPLVPRVFLDQLAAEPEVDLVHGEISYPAMAEVLGYRILDSGLHPGWDGVDEARCFTAAAHPSPPPSSRRSWRTRSAGVPSIRSPRAST